MSASPGPLGFHAFTNGRRRSAIVSLCLLVAPATSARAQTRTSADSVRAAKSLFTWRDAALAAGFTTLTLATFPLDRTAAGELQEPSNQSNRFLRNASRDVQYVADPGSVVIGVSMYTIGRLGGWRNVADLGLHGAEAVALSGAVTAVVKGFAGRSRPYVSRDTNAHDFAFGRGFTGGQFASFPSGHTSAAFAAASAVTSESRRWWPHETWLVGTAMYGGATLVAVSRMYNNAHWASDVAVGAAIGTFSGLKVVRYSHGHPKNLLDRILLSAFAAPTADGMVIGASLEP